MTEKQSSHHDINITSLQMGAILRQSSDSPMENMLRMFQKLFRGQLKSLMVTNYGSKPPQKNIYYFRVTDHLLVYREETSTIKNNYTIDLKDGKLTLNDHIMGDNVPSEFLEKLQQLSYDITHQRVLVLEEHK